MTIVEWWAEYEVQGGNVVAGKLTQDDIDEIMDFLDEDNSDGVAGNQG